LPWTFALRSGDRLAAAAAAVASLSGTSNVHWPFYMLAVRNTLPYFVLLWSGASSVFLVRDLSSWHRRRWRFMSYGIWKRVGWVGVEGGILTEEGGSERRDLSK
jgi:hypothetical protein